MDKKVKFFKGGWSSHDERCNAFSAVAEIQGPYGPFTLSERVIQKIWHRQDFLSTARLQTLSGKSLRIINPGRWNFQEGPDFREAQLEIDEQALIGDVEVHFYSKDWFAHAHERNPNFEHTVLHGVLFPPHKNEPLAITSNGRRLETFVFLDCLAHDLEAYAQNEIILGLEGRYHSDLVDRFLELPLTQRRGLFKEKARVRWHQKKIYAQRRLAAHSWAESCHQLCLEALGYRRNRGAMGSLALEFPLKAMRKAGLTATDLFTRQKGSWKLSGIRPANHPRVRLHQYLELVERNPNWPTELLRLIEGLTEETQEENSTDFRRKTNLQQFRMDLQRVGFSGCVGVSRLNTLVCDVFLPLGAEVLGQDFFPRWFHWWGGDIPEGLSAFLKQCQILDVCRYPNCNGWNQGAIQLLLEENL